MQLQNIKIVLVETSHPGNIGASARAMKTMGFSQLVLVNPQVFPDPQATAMAAGAEDLLTKAQVMSNLQQAVADCQLVIAASARQRSIKQQMLNVRAVGEMLAQPGLVTAENQDFKVALVFGRESSGLTNSELDVCKYLAQIPVNPEYGSLNLAAAVQIFCYEISLALQQANQATKLANNAQPGLVTAPKLATQQQLEDFFQHLEQTLLTIGFLKSQPETEIKHDKILRKLRQLYQKADLSEQEIAILRGILSATLKTLQKAPKASKQIN